MSEYNYKDIVSKAKVIKKNVKENYELGVTNKWIYYICKAIISPKSSKFKGVKIEDAKKVKGTAISRQIFKTSYIDMAERIIRYVEREEQLPSTVKFTTKSGKVYHINIDVATEMFSRILVYLDTNKAYPRYADINSKCFTAPTETSNAVYDNVTKKTGIKFITLDDVLAYVKKYGRYIFEYDDVRSNAEVTECMCGNCTDWLQWLWNMAKAMGYDVRAIHVQCRVSGTGHVRGQFRHAKNTGGKWIDRDPAAVADGGDITDIWCDDGYVLGTNPAWFLQNLNR